MWRGRDIEINPTNPNQGAPADFHGRVRRDDLCLTVDKETNVTVASMNPDNMLQGGLKDDFKGIIRKVRLCPWDYDGKIPHYVLAVAVTIEEKEPEDPKNPIFVQHYSAGDLDSFIPSMDGETGVDLAADAPQAPEDGADEATVDAYHQALSAYKESLEGIYALRVGKKEQLNNNTNWAHFIRAALEARFPVEKLTAAVSCFEGVEAQFNRVPQAQRKGLVKAQAAEEKKRANDILVITEILNLDALTKGQKAAAPKSPASPAASKSAAKPAASKTPTSTPAAAASSGNGGGGDLDAKLGDIVRAAVAEAPEGLHKSKLPAAALAKLSAAEKGKGVARITNADFLSSVTGIAFDAESGTIYNAS